MDSISVSIKLPHIKETVLIADVTNIKRNIYWNYVERESVEEYKEGRYWISKSGTKIQAIVLDGRTGIKEVFKDIPIQMCQFHQIAIVTRYLTRRPKLEASRELRYLTLNLTKTTEEEFYTRLETWYRKWEDFLKEKTVDTQTGEWFYTHGRVRSAYNSLISNKPYLFTYQKYPDLNIPNTTNSLDGSFSHLKNLLNSHRGLRLHRKLKLIDELLGNT